MSKHQRKNFYTHQKLSLLNHVYTSNSHNFIPIEKKIKIKIHPTMPKATYNAKLHKPSTLSKLDKSQTTQQSKIPHSNQHAYTQQFFIQHIQHSRIPIRANSNKITMPTINSSSTKQKIEKLTNKNKKIELTLRSLVDGSGALLSGS